MSKNTTTTEQPASSESKGNRPTHRIYIVTARGEGYKNRWTECGVSFANKDGSTNERYFLPVLPDMDIQRRPFDEHSKDAAEQE